MFKMALLFRGLRSGSRKASWRNAIYSWPTLTSRRQMVSTSPVLLQPLAPTSSKPSESRKPVMVTTPIYYVNGAPHIGHLYSSLIADALARWNRLQGHQTLFSTGTDEHGQKVQEAASSSGVECSAFCTDISEKFKEAFGVAGIVYDDFIRTTEPRHAEAVQHIWQTLKENDHIYLGEYKGWYCQADEAFLTDSQVDRIQKDDGTFATVSSESGRPVELLTEQNYMFRLSHFQDKLLQWIDENPDAIYPSVRRNEVRAMIERGLQDLSVSRLKQKLQWAIPVPDAPGHVVYVWLDALTNYLTVTGYPAAAKETSAWPADYQIIGKDIIKFHCVYWPAFLMAAGLPLPKKIVAHAHWTVDRVKMSKTLGNVVDPFKAMETFGVDAIRYFLLREGGIADDGDFSSEIVKLRVNSELAFSLGNLASRCTSARILKNKTLPSCFALSDEDAALVARMNELPAKVKSAFDVPEFGKGISLIMGFLTEINQFVQANEPWALAKRSDEKSQERLQTVVYVALEAVRFAATLLLPVIPSAATRALDYLSVKPELRTYDNLKFGKLNSGGKLQHPDKPGARFILIPQIE